MRHRDLTRRELIVAAAAGLVGIGVRGRPSRRDEWSHEDQLLYVGTYTESGRTDGIFLVLMDPRTGALRQVGAVDAGANPSFLAIHPNGRWMYAVNERDDGGVRALSIDQHSGALTRINEQPSRGGAPCYVSVDRGGRVAFVANYGTGSIALLPIGKAGALAPAASVHQQRGTGPVSDRQDGPHAHCILTDRSNRFALATDLGADRVFVYRLDVRGGSLEHREANDARLPRGSGPRHLALHPRLPLVFVSNELSSTVTTMHFDATRGALTVLDTRATVPAGWTGANYPADIHVAPSGRTLYVSNRGHDSIAVFSIAPRTGAMEWRQAVATGGDWPRNFSLDPSGRWLLVANQRSGTVTVLSRDPASGRLAPTSRQLAIASPACVRFRARPGVTT